MKKIVCLHNVYFEGRFLSAGTDAALPDDVACNWVERGLAKFVGEETLVNPPAQDNKADASTSDGEDNLRTDGNGALQELPPSADISQDVPPDVPSEVKPEEKAVELPPVIDDDVPKRGRPPKKKNGGKRR